MQNIFVLNRKMYFSQIEEEKNSSNYNMYLSQITKCICLNCKMNLCQLQNIFVSHCKMYLSQTKKKNCLKLQNILVKKFKTDLSQIAKCICL